MAAGSDPTPGRLAEILPRARSPIVVVCTLVLIAALTVAGSHALGDPQRLFDLDLEYTFPALLNACLLGAAGLTALTFAQLLERGAPGRRAALTLGGILLFMAVDEAVMLHERTSWVLGLHWTTWYLPVIIALVWAMLSVGRAFPVARPLFYATLVLWVVSGLMEVVFWGPDLGRQHPLSIAIEESSEMLASFALLQGLLRAHADA